MLTSWKSVKNYIDNLQKNLTLALNQTILKISRNHTIGNIQWFRRNLKKHISISECFFLSLKEMVSILPSNILKWFIET